MGRKKSNKNPNQNGVTLGFEANLWQAADKLRNNMDVAEYKHVVLGLIFLKYISDTFEEKRASLQEVRWPYLQAKAKQPEIGTLIDNAMHTIEGENPRLKGVLPKNYACSMLDKQRLGELVELIGTIGLGGKVNRAEDIFGRIYEYFLAQFANAEGKRGGQFYTPRCVVQLLVEMLAPYKGLVYDPCCGSGALLVQSEKFVDIHGGRRDDISIFGQEFNPTARQLALMHFTIRGIEANLGQEHADSFHRDLHPDLKADYILVNPPFNSQEWGGDRLRADKRWVYGVPPPGNANFAWVQHFIYHLAPNGIAGFVLPNGSMSSNAANEGEIRRKIIKADLVDCMVALPGQLFYYTSIPVCLWFIARNKENPRFRKRSGETLFIDARRSGNMIDRVHRELTHGEIAGIAETYHTWRGDKDTNEYADVPGFCKSAKLDDILEYGGVLTPERYVGVEEIGKDEIPIEKQIAQLSKKLYEQLEESERIGTAIKKNLEALNYRGKQ